LGLGTQLDCARFGFELLPTLSSDADPPGWIPDAGLFPRSHRDASVAQPPVSSAAPDAASDPTEPVADLDAGDNALDANPATSAPDAAGALPRCVAFGPFAPAELLQGLAQSNMIGPALSADALTLLYVDGTSFDIYVATRPDRDSPFSNGSPLPGINTPGVEVTPFLTSDDLTLIFGSDRPGSVGLSDLMIATRPNPNAAFSTPVFLVGVNSNTDEIEPHLTLDGRELYFSSERNGGRGLRDVWRATRTNPNGNFGNLTPLTEINSSAADFGASLSLDALEIFFASDRPGGQGSMDLWRAERTRADQPFGAPQNLSALNGSGYDTDPRISLDGTELVFTSNRTGPQVLWGARRACVSSVP